MADPSPKRGDIDRRLEGAPLSIGGQTITPVARVTGKHVLFDSANGHGVGCRLSVRPEEVIQRLADGNELRIGITDPTRQILRQILAIGGLVAGLCLGLMLVFGKRRA